MIGCDARPLRACWHRLRGWSGHHEGLEIGRWDVDRVLLIQPYCGVRELRERESINYRCFVVGKRMGIMCGGEASVLNVRRTDKGDETVIRSTDPEGRGAV